MKKSELVETQIALREYGEQVESAREFAVNCIQQGVSLLANIDPEFAIDAIKQLHEQIAEINNMIEQNAKVKKEYTNEMVALLPDSIEFDDEDSDG